MSKIKHFSGGCKNLNPTKNIPTYGDKVKKLYGWQVRAFDKQRDEQFALISAFCGSGKSILQIALAIHDVVKSGWAQKQLIIVPQQHISQGFSPIDAEGVPECISVRVDGEQYDWRVGRNNFCDPKKSGVIASLKQWLLQDGAILGKKFRGTTTVMGLNAVASHQALGLAWGDLTLKERERAVRNLTLRIDEAHHVNGVFDIREDGLTDMEKLAIEEESTNLGGICRFLINHGDRTAKLHLTTATFFRGDKRHILSTAVQNKFTPFFLDWLEHWKTLGISDFQFGYEEYDKDPIALIMANIKKEPREKHMVVIPASGTKWRADGKKELKRLLDALYELYPRDRVLDLVTRETQDENKKKLLREPKRREDGPSKFDVVVTCMLGREGTDWCPCSRMHNAACEGSVTLAVQTIGRIFRRFTGKTKVRALYYVRRFTALKEGLSKRELFSERTNALLTCIQLDEMCHPLEIVKFTGENKKTSGPSGEHVSLPEIFNSHYQTVKERLARELEELAADTQELKSEKRLLELRAGLHRIVEDIVKDYKTAIGKHRKGVTNQLRLMAVRMWNPDFRDLGFDVSILRKMGFDKIVEKWCTSDRSIFFGKMRSTDWTTLRTYVKTYWKEMLLAWAEREKKNQRKGVHHVTAV